MPVTSSGSPTESISLSPAPGQRQQSDSSDSPRRAFSATSVHVPVLDGVRGVAILLVLVYHLALWVLGPPAGRAGKLFYEIALRGWVGVDLFFVLSGFLITGILYDAKGGAHFFRNFYARRSLRIFPLYFAVLAVVIGLLPRLIPEHRGLLRLADDGAWYWTYTTNLLIARDGWPDTAALAHFWSLAVEEQFYLVWPFVVFCLARKRLLSVCAGCVVLAIFVRLGLAASHHTVASMVLMPARMDALAAGALVALLARGPGGLAVYRRCARWVMFAAGTAFVALTVVYHDSYSRPLLGGGLTSLSCLFASLLVLLLTAAPGSPLSALFGSRALRFFGRYSYGLYVFHHPLLFVVTPTAVAAALTWLPSRGDLAPRLVIIGAVMVLSLTLSVLSWHLLEQPFLRLKDRLPYGRGPGRPQQDPLVAPAPLPT